MTREEAEQRQAMGEGERRVGEESQRGGSGKWIG